MRCARNLLAISVFFSLPIFSFGSTLPTGLFTGKVSGDFYAKCRVHTVEFETFELETSQETKDSQSIRIIWKETGSTNGEASRPCQNELDALLTLRGVQENGARVYHVLFDWMSTTSPAEATFFENKLSFRANGFDMNGEPFELTADLLFKKMVPENTDESAVPFNLITYARALLPRANTNHWVTGRLMLNDSIVKISKEN